MVRECPLFPLSGTSLRNEEVFSLTCEREEALTFFILHALQCLTSEMHHPHSTKPSLVALCQASLSLTVLSTKGTGNLFLIYHAALVWPMLTDTKVLFLLELTRNYSSDPWSMLGRTEVYFRSTQMYHVTILSTTQWSFQSSIHEGVMERPRLHCFSGFIWEWDSGLIFSWLIHYFRVLLFHNWWVVD